MKPKELGPLLLYVHRDGLPCSLLVLLRVLLLLVQLQFRTIELEHTE